MKQVMYSLLGLLLVVSGAIEAVPPKNRGNAKRAQGNLGTPQRNNATSSEQETPPSAPAKTPQNTPMLAGSTSNVLATPPRRTTPLADLYKSPVDTLHSVEIPQLIMELKKDDGLCLEQADILELQPFAEAYLASNGEMADEGFISKVLRIRGEPNGLAKTVLGKSKTGYYLVYAEVLVEKAKEIKSKPQEEKKKAADKREKASNLTGLIAQFNQDLISNPQESNTAQQEQKKEAQDTVTSTIPQQPAVAITRFEDLHLDGAALTAVQDAIESYSKDSTKKNLIFSVIATKTKVKLPVGWTEGAGLTEFTSHVMGRENRKRDERIKQEQEKKANEERLARLTSAFAAKRLQEEKEKQAAEKKKQLEEERAAQVAREAEAQRLADEVEAEKEKKRKQEEAETAAREKAVADAREAALKKEQEEKARKEAEEQLARDKEEAKKAEEDKRAADALAEAKRLEDAKRAQELAEAKLAREREAFNQERVENEKKVAAALETKRKAEEAAERAEKLKKASAELGAFDREYLLPAFEEYVRGKLGITDPTAKPSEEQLATALVEINERYLGVDLGVQFDSLKQNTGLKVSGALGVVQRMWVSVRKPHLTLESFRDASSEHSKLVAVVVKAYTNYRSATDKPLHSATGKSLTKPIMFPWKPLAAGVGLIVLGTVAGRNATVKRTVSRMALKFKGTRAASWLRGWCASCKAKGTAAPVRSIAKATPIKVKAGFWR